MSNPAPLPQQTPNVVVKNPAVRRVATTVLGIVGVSLGTAIVVDGSTDAFDITAITGPISAAYLYLGSVFGLAVTVPNVPKR